MYLRNIVMDIHEYQVSLCGLLLYTQKDLDQRVFNANNYSLIWIILHVLAMTKSATNNAIMAYILFL